MATCLVTAVIITEPPFRLQWRPNNLSLRLISSSRLYARWDSNAETVRTRRFGFDFKRGGQNDDEYDQNDGEEDEEEGFFKTKKKKRRWWSDDFDDGGIIEEAFDYIWIFKVFKAYGWFFPVIIVSWLLSSGPKAFLMAMALPLGQSLLWMAFDKLWGGTKRKPKRRSGTRTKWPKTATDTRTRTSFDEEEEEEEEGAEPRRGKRGYQSWTVDGGREKETGFGGWDDLESSVKSGPRKRDSVPAEEESKGKLSRRRARRSDTPLFMRLLIAVFPFLNSWTKILW